MDLCTRRQFGRGLAMVSAGLLGLACSPREGSLPSRSANPPIALTSAPAAAPSPTPWNPPYASGSTASSTAVAGLRGKLILAVNGNLTLFDLATKQATAITSYSKSTLVAAPAFSPDRKRLAYTIYAQSQGGNDLGGSDLFVVGPAGEQTTQVSFDLSTGIEWLA